MKYPQWVCEDCGKKAAKKSYIKQMFVSTWHMDKCDVCGEEKAVTEPRDFGYPKFNDKGDE